MWYNFLDFLSNNFETVATIFGCVIVGASAASAFIPGAGLLKKILSVLALNVKNATPEQIASAKKAIEAAKALTDKPAEEKSEKKK